MAERVAGLALRHRAEQRGDVGVALDVGLLREVEVPAVRLALPRERFLEVVLGLAAVEVGHALLLVGVWLVASERSVTGSRLDGLARERSLRRPRGTPPRPPRRVNSPAVPRRARGGRRCRASTSRTVPHRVHTRCWCACSTLGSTRMLPVPTSSSSTSPMRLEVVDGLVDGLERDGRHLGAGRVVERLDRRVRVDAVQQAEDRLALRSDPQALGPEARGELVDRLHGSHLSTFIVIDKPSPATIGGGHGVW